MKSGLIDLLRNISGGIVSKKDTRFIKDKSRTISKILSASNIKPHKIKCYITKVDPEFDQKAANVLAIYREANELSEKMKKRRN